MDDSEEQIFRVFRDEQQFSQYQSSYRQKHTLYKQIKTALACNAMAFTQLELALQDERELASSTPRQSEDQTAEPIAAKRGEATAGDGKIRAIQEQMDALWKEREQVLMAMTCGN